MCRLVWKLEFDVVISLVLEIVFWKFICVSHCNPHHRLYDR